MRTNEAGAPKGPFPPSNLFIAPLPHLRDMWVTACMLNHVFRDLASTFRLVYTRRLIFTLSRFFGASVWLRAPVMYSSATHLHSSLPPFSFLPTLLIFLFAPVYNWILFSGTYKCLRLLCLCLTPHFLPLLHPHPRLLSLPSLFPSVVACVKPLFLLSFSFVFHHSYETVHCDERRTKGPAQPGVA